MQSPKYTLAISRLSVLIEHLYIQAQETDQLNSRQKSHRLIENNDLFSRHIFTTQSDKISLYVDEVKRKLSEFSRLYNSSSDCSSSDNSNRVEVAKSSLHHIEQQISALMNALQANSTMHQAAQASFDARKSARVKSIKAAQVKQSEKYNKMAKSVLLSSHQLYQQLNEHREFERRLMNMISEREQERVRAKTINNNKLSQEVLALHQRLGRCRKAISTIERNIEIAEKR